MRKPCPKGCTCRPLTIALAGNPNVGKSTVFNHLTGLHQHTGNWPGKTVACQSGRVRHNGRQMDIIDTPGTYSLLSGSKEEEVARDFLCFGEHDCVIAVADATCLERNLNLVLQISEITPNLILCVNLLDEAKRKGIRIDKVELERRLGIPVVFCTARSGKGIRALLDTVQQARSNAPRDIPYPPELERELAQLGAQLKLAKSCRLSPRFVALRLLEGGNLSDSLAIETGIHKNDPQLQTALSLARERLRAAFGDRPISEIIVGAIVRQAEQIHTAVVQREDYRDLDRRLDKILTGPSGIPIMLALLLFIFWLTVAGSNYPSALLQEGLFKLQALARDGLAALGAPELLNRLLTDGILRTLFWVVSVMLPPMAIFFPLFTLLEDFGLLPRIAFTLDGCFAKAGTCGKQALTMCMGLGCNAVGVTGCRIIDSPRERLIAILTNSLMPCNGRFPSMIAVSALLFSAGGLCGSFGAALVIFGVILVGAGLTLLLSALLSKTLLRGLPSSFTLELPPYRKPDSMRVITRSILDRTLFVLGRAAAVAAPAGLIIWLMANCRFADRTLLALCGALLDPLGQLMGLDGYILMAFILGFPANEIVIPILLMSYLQTGTMTELSGAGLSQLLTQNGWTGLTAVCFLLFSLVHFPCSTTCLTIKKETGSARWTAASLLLPTALGILLCTLVATVARIFL